MANKHLIQIGTKSLIFGIHQVFWHPYTVYRAWKELYGPPSWKELICIIIHDWGYWGLPDLDGQEGSLHPFFGAGLALKYLGMDYYDLCLGHSRHLAQMMNRKPSRLCYADKLSFKYDPRWFYLLRSWLSGELQELRYRSAMNGFVSFDKTHREWYTWAYDMMVTLGKKQDATTKPYFK